MYLIAVALMKNNFFHKSNASRVEMDAAIDRGRKIDKEFLNLILIMVQVCFDAKQTDSSIPWSCKRSGTQA